MLRTLTSGLLLFALAGFAQHNPAAELRKVLDRQTAAWNKNDLNAFMQTYWHSPELTFFSGDTITSGWESTLERYRKRYGGGKQMGQLSFTEEKIDLLGPDSALVTARWHLVMPSGEKREGLTSVVCKRMQDGWKIIHDHSS